MTEEVMFLPPFQTPVKPKYLEPCNGCGWCCHEEICTVGKIFFDMCDEDQMIPHFIKGPCPAMTFIDNKVRCGVVLAEAHIADGKTITADALGIGKGCDATTPQGY